ncbi:MAG: heme ABC exporter ATP-binding protein CcmA [Terricaulis sp.]
MGANRPFREEPKLRVESLAVARGGRVIFEGLGFVAEAGALVELRGANGSGKTSLLRALAGFLKPLTGRVVFENIHEPALALHYVGHQNGLKPTASVRAHLAYWAGLLGGAVTGEDVSMTVGLAGLADLPARVLSQGQARRLAIARLLLAPRPIWLLDEPASALDAKGRTVLANVIEAHCAQGGLVLAAVHEPLGPSPTQVLSIGGAS